MSNLIVCATDFSPEAEGALAWAAAMARRDGGHIDLVFVSRSVSEGSSLLGFEAEQVELDMSRLREVARAASQEFGISIRSYILRGEPHEAILKRARDEGARMIVLGTGGLALLERLMLGSVAERTVRSADRPVVLVPGRPARNVWTKAGTDAIGRAPRVLAGLGNGDDAAILHFATTLRLEAPCDVTFLRLYWPLEEYARLGLQGTRDLFKADHDVIKSLEAGSSFEDHGPAGRRGCRPRHSPRVGRAGIEPARCRRGLRSRSARRRRDERHGVGRFLTATIAQRLARQSRYVPVAIVPASPTKTAHLSGIPMLRTILVATDLSALGNAAVAQAYALVRGTGGVVELCHVHEHALPSPAYAYDAPAPRLTDLDRARLAKELRDLVPTEATSLGIATHISIIDGGKAGEAIVQTAERLDVDAIAMASHGRSGLARTVLGSVAQEVVHRAHRPVYVVRSH
jgi:nucleotide-binding universal stress UspA family protein